MDSFDPIEDFSPEKALQNFHSSPPSDLHNLAGLGFDTRQEEDNDIRDVNALQALSPPPQLPSRYPSQSLQSINDIAQQNFPTSDDDAPTWTDDDRFSLHSAYSIAQRLKRQALREEREGEDVAEVVRKERIQMSVRETEQNIGEQEERELMMSMKNKEVGGLGESNIHKPRQINQVHMATPDDATLEPSQYNLASPVTTIRRSVSFPSQSISNAATRLPFVTGQFPIYQSHADPPSTTGITDSRAVVGQGIGVRPEHEVDDTDDLLSICSYPSSSAFSLALSPLPRNPLHEEEQPRRLIMHADAHSVPPPPSPLSSRASTPVNWIVGDNHEERRGIGELERRDAEVRHGVLKEAQTRRVRFEGGKGGMESEVEGNEESMVEQNVTSGQVERGIDMDEVADDIDDMSEKIIMAINYSHRRLGCAYYNCATEKLYLMEDMEESPPFDLVKMIKFQICPTTIVTSARMDEDFITVLKENDLGIPRPPPVDLQPSTSFTYVVGRNRLLSTRIRAMSAARGGVNRQYDLRGGGDTSKKDVYLYLAGFVDMGSHVTVSCAGALIGYLNKARAEGLLPETDEDEERPFEVLSVELFSLNTIMHVNADTLCSLQIFENEAHPNMHQTRGREGLSLYGILNNTRTTLGAQLLKQWFLRPSLDLALLDRRHRTITCLLQPENLPVAEQVGACLHNIKNVPKILESLKGRAKVGEWQQLLQFAYYCLRIRNLLRELTNCDVPIVNKIKETFVVSDLKDVGSFINDVVNFDESATENRFVVKQHVDEELDELKRVYAGLDEFLFRIAQEISTMIPSNFASTLNVIYFPQLGYLITVPLRPEWTEEDDFQIEGLYYQFSTATTVYYKNDRMRELDETLGDIHSLIVDKEIEIMQMLSERVLEYAPLLIAAAEVCAELDCLLSLANAARKFNYHKPVMIEENVLKVVRGRHPLQELCVDIFIPNDTYLIGGRGVEQPYSADNDDDHDDDRMLGESASDQESLSVESAKRNDNRRNGESSQPRGGDDVNSVILLSGANYSGKSVYLKQVALITYMAHIGSFVPAESATIGLTDKIFTRVQTRETISKVGCAIPEVRLRSKSNSGGLIFLLAPQWKQIESAFMLDLQQVSIALRNATKRSLIVIDEFGKGTGSTDGAGLFCAVLEHFLYRGAECPKLVAATHFHELFQQDLISPSLPITMCTMEIVREKHTSKSETDSSTDTESRDSRTVMAEELTFLYRLVQGGSSGASWGTWCAAMAGMPEEIVLRAIYLSDLFSRHESLPEQLTDEDRRKYAQCERIARRFLQLDLDEPTNMGPVKEFFEWLGLTDNDDDDGESV